MTSYSYSSLNQQLTHTDALNAKTQFEYDANGNLTKATDAKGNATTYAYDALNQNTVITFANGLSLQYTYDELGRVVSSKDRAGREFKYAYNPLGNLLTKTYPDGTTDRYTYDGISRMLSAVNKNATVNFTYDRAGRLLSETLNGKVTGYSYDVAAGKRILTYPSGMKVVEQLNARDQIVSILQNGDEVVTMDYNAAGQKTSQGYANGITTTYGYNENGWLSSIVADHDIMNLQMTYDAIGNMTERKDMLNADRTESYGYDVISQLTSFRRGTTVDKSYEFDLLGNRIRTLENGVATNYTSNNVNAYTAITGGLNFTPQYDDNGNMLNDDKHTYAYDYNNKLVSVDQTVGTYKYDALGRRISKFREAREGQPEQHTLFYYVGDQMVEEVTDGATTSYVYGNNIDEALQITKDDKAYYYHSNHLGSVMALSDAQGHLQERGDYDVYGIPSFTDAAGNTIARSSIGNTTLFTGREYDYEADIFYFRARSQHPTIGRFMQKDPLMYVDGMNDYTYVCNNSLVYIDLTGKGFLSIGFKSVGGKALIKTAERNIEKELKKTGKTVTENYAKKKIIRKIEEEGGKKAVSHELSRRRMLDKAKNMNFWDKIAYLNKNGTPAFALIIATPEMSRLMNEFNQAVGDEWEKAKLNALLKLNDLLKEYDKYDQWGTDTFRYSANWWFRVFHGGEDYNGCNGLFDPDDVADLLWQLTSPI